MIDLKARCLPPFNYWRLYLNHYFAINSRSLAATPKWQLINDVTPGLVRLSFGLETIETIEDIEAGLEKGLAAAAAI